MLRPVKFESAREAREFIAKYEGVENSRFMDTRDYVYQFIRQEYPMKLITISIR